MVGQDRTGAAPGTATRTDLNRARPRSPAETEDPAPGPGAGGRPDRWRTRVHPGREPPAPASSAQGDSADGGVVHGLPYVQDGVDPGDLAEQPDLP
ncbi:hypothetical protein GCM10010266_34480 [Streptomyces griseomycini]|nr:hypothetical protein GCM10010266_34480 [Streptomyces griseomycini]